MSNWCLPVPIEPDELFSAWLARAALTQGCDPLVLTGAVWPGWRAWIRDLDREVSGERLELLSRVSGIGVSSFEAASLCSTVKSITTKPLANLAVWPWVLAQGHRNRRRLGGLQYCPMCLAGDRSPYYRRQWRLAWHVGCPLHRVKLLDRCWDCHAPVEPHRLEATDRHLAFCAECKQDLRKAPAVVHYSEAAFSFQSAADAVVYSGRGIFSGKHITSHQWFTLARYFLAVLRKVALRPTDNLASMVKTLGVSLGGIPSSATGLPFEMLPLDEREALIREAWVLLKVNLEDFIEAAISYSVTRATLYGISNFIPEPLEDIVVFLHDGATPRSKNEVVKGLVAPRSKRCVLRMYARLQRKLPRGAL